MKRCLKIFLLTISLFGLWACNSPSGPATSEASEQDVAALKSNMNEAFAALEMYAAENAMSYPDDLLALQPKYLDEAPRDPRSAKPLTYQKTEAGFLLGASGDYTSLECEPGFPKMDQDGFFVKRASEFPNEDSVFTQDAEKALLPK